MFNKINPNLFAFILLVLTFALGWYFFHPRESIGTVVRVYDPASVEVRGFRPDANEHVDVWDPATSELLADTHLTDVQRAILAVVLDIKLRNKEVRATWTPEPGYHMESSVSAGRASEIRVDGRLYVELVLQGLAATLRDSNDSDVLKKIVRMATAE